MESKLLNQRKLALEVKKLESETSNIETQRANLEVQKLSSDLGHLGQFSTKVWPIIGTLITLFISGFAIFVSVETQQHQREFEQTQKHREGLTEALKLATDGSGEVDRRIAGIWELKQYWDSPDDFEIVASVLAAELTLPDKDRLARCAAAEVIGAAMDGNSHRRELAALLFGDTDGRIGLVTQQHQLLLSSGSPTQATNHCLTALDATREAIRKNWKYLRSVNLSDLDLSDIQLYSADLAGSTFRNSVLVKSNFRCSNLSNTDFTEANWTTADLKFANVNGAKPEEFKRFAVAAGAFDMDDNQWREWRTFGFPVLGNPAMASFPDGNPADCLHSTRISNTGAH